MPDISREEFNRLCDQMDATCEKVDKVLENHIPHIQSDIAEIRGGFKTAAWIVGVILALLGIGVTVLIAFIV